MRGAVGVHDLAHDDRAIFLGAIGIDCDRLQNAIRTVAFGLLGRTSVKTPHWNLFQGRKSAEVLDEGFAADVGHRLIAVEPDVFQFVLSHLLSAWVGGLMVEDGAGSANLACSRVGLSSFFQVGRARRHPQQIGCQILGSRKRRAGGFRWPRGFARASFLRFRTCRSARAGHAVRVHARREGYSTSQGPDRL